MRSKILTLFALAGCGLGPAANPDRPLEDVSGPIEPASSHVVPWGSFELPRDHACTIESGHAWLARGDREVDISLDAGGAPVARVRAYARRGVLLFPEGPRPELQPVELEDEGVVVRGMIDAQASELRMQRFVSFGQHLAPKTFTRFDWRRASPGEVELELVPLARYVPAEPAVVRAPCEDVSVGEVTGVWSPRDLPTSLGVGDYGEKVVHLSTTSEVRLHDAPEGRAIGRFTAGETLPVYELERREGYVRVLFSSYAEVIGWVRESYVAPFAEGGLELPKGPEPESLRRRPHAVVRCPEDVHFAVVRDKTKTFFGLFRAGTAFGVDSAAPEDEAVVVRPMRGTLREGSGVEWFARRSDLGGCENVPPDR